MSASWLAMLTALVALAALSACSSAARDSQPPFPTPAYNGSNGQEMQGDTVEGLNADSLEDLKTKADIVVLASVVDQKLLESDTLEGGEQPEMWTTLRIAKVDQVLWQRPSGEKAPDELSFVGLGWNRNNDTGKVTALVPESGARVDVGDQFIAGFRYLRPPADSQHAEGYDAAPSHWTYLVHGIALVKDDRVSAPEGDGEFLSAFDNKTVAEFSQALRSEGDIG